jgi:5-methylcytosine-specific restriction endonuclease McrA
MAREVHPRQRRERELLPEKLGRCKWCGGEAKPPRKFWCSDQCVQEYLDQDPKELRSKVLERDHGVCAGCGRDTEAIRKRVEERLAPFREYGAAWPAQKRALRWDGLLQRLKLSAGTCYLRHLWEADHIVPVVEGGPNTLANLRTLCLPCHKGETRALAARRAKARRKQVELELPAGAAGATGAPGRMQGGGHPT